MKIIRTDKFLLKITFRFKFKFSNLRLLNCSFIEEKKGFIYIIQNCFVSSNGLVAYRRPYSYVYRMSRIKPDMGKLPYLGFWASNASSLSKIGQFLIATY